MFSWGIYASLDLNELKDMIKRNGKKSNLAFLAPWYWYFVAPLQFHFVQGNGAYRVVKAYYVWLCSLKYFEQCRLYLSIHVFFFFFFLGGGGGGGGGIVAVMSHIQLILESSRKLNMVLYIIAIARYKK